MSTPVGIGSLTRQMPYASIALDKEMAKAAKEFKPGQVVKLTIVGTLTSMNFSKSDDPEEKGFEGHLSLDIRNLGIGLSQKNAIAELLDDDE